MWDNLLILLGASWQFLHEKKAIIVQLALFGSYKHLLDCYTQDCLANLHRHRNRSHILPIRFFLRSFKRYY
jgi:hypothetical protein